MNQLTDFTTNFQERQLFLPMDLAKIIPDNDSVRVLSDILEVLNYSKLMQEYSEFGRNPIVNPKVLFKILVYAFMNNIYSSRQIEKACRRDINFMWLLQGASVPSHNTINRFRSKKLINCMEDLFYQLVTKLSVMGEIDFNNLFIDGTKIEANANKYTFKWKKSILKYDKKLDIKIEELLNDFNFRNKTYFSDIYDLQLHIKSEIFEKNILFTNGKGKKKHQLQKDCELIEEYLKRKSRKND
jgi:transposase